MNDLPVGRSVDEALRLVQAFQFTVCFFFLWMALLIVDCGVRISMVKCVL